MLPGNDKKGVHPLQKFRPPNPSQKLSELLKPDALDEETRQRIVRDVMGHGPSPTPPSGLDTPLYAPRRGLIQEGNHPSNLRERVASGNTDLLGVMAQRLKTLEAQQRAYRLEMKEKTDRIAELEDKYAGEKAKREEAEAMLLELYDEKKALEDLVQEMKHFLADYGLKWKGDDKRKGNGSKNRDEKGVLSTAASCTKPFDLYEGDFVYELPEPRTSSSSSPKKSESAAVVPIATSCDGFSLDLELLKRNARILSDHVGQKGVVKDGKHGAIREREVVTVAVYKNGICVNGGLFRPFGWPLCDAVVRDLVEGYYPYEFKEKYPDGFPIEIVDHSSVAFRTDSSGVEASDVRSLQGMQTKGQQPITREEFLKRLPAARITANGHIVQVRENVTGMVNGAVENATVRHVTAAEARHREVSGGTPVVESGKDAAAVPPQRIKGMVAVLVRFPSGQKLTLQMDPDSTVADMRREVQLAIPSFTKAYEFRMMYPSKALSNHTQTLRELGLLTSCTLFIQLHTVASA